MIRKLKIPIVLFLSLYALGVLFFKFTEGFNWIDSFYFVGNTLSALGYGDIHPITNAGKIFSAFFNFAGIGIFFYIINVISRPRAERK